VLGNSDLRTADHAAKLYLDGYAPTVVVSGKEGHQTKGKYSYFNFCVSQILEVQKWQVLTVKYN